MDLLFLGAMSNHVPKRFGSRADAMASLGLRIMPIYRDIQETVSTIKTQGKHRSIWPGVWERGHVSLYNYPAVIYVSILSWV